MNEKSNSRRDFLKKGFLAAAAATAAPLVAKAKPAGEKVKMLTPDGKLVEVDKSILSKAPKKKVSNKDILDWRSSKG